MSNATCYRLTIPQDAIPQNFTSAGDVPCRTPTGPDDIVPCCYSGDTCLEDNICRSLTPHEGASEYYTADCTDPTYQSSVCNQACTTFWSASVVYDSTQLWVCCGTVGDYAGADANCGDPTNVTFRAPSPAELVSAYDASLSSQTSSLVSTSPTTSTSASPALASTSLSSSSNSSGAGVIAGAVVGAVVGVLLSTITVIFLVRWGRRKHRTHDLGYGPSPLAQPLKELPETTWEMGPPQTNELPGRLLSPGSGGMRYAELPGNKNPADTAEVG